MLYIESARPPWIRFVEQDAHSLDLGEEFDYIICSDLVNDLWDVQQVLEAVRRHSMASTRVILNAHSRMWELPRRMAEQVGVAKRQPTQNWLTAEDISNLLSLADFEVIRTWQEILWPLRTPIMDSVFNRGLVKIAPFRWFALTNMIVARPRPCPHAHPEPVVTVVVPARNEAGNIAHILDRVPEMGGGTELIFVEGNSKDDTYEVIGREIARRPGCQARLYRQTGKAKGDAVRLGIANATGEVLRILDRVLPV